MVRLRTGWRRRAPHVLAVVVAIGLLAPIYARPTALAAAEKPGAGPAGAPSPSAKLDALTQLLADPDVQALLAHRGAAASEAPSPNAPPKTMAISLADRLDGLRQHLVALTAATKTLPDDAAMARSMVAGALDQRGWWTAGAFFVGFIALGFGTEWLFRLALRPAQRWLLALKLTSANERVRAVFARLTFGLGLVVSFGLGSVGAFLAFDWPITLKELLLGYLIAFLLARLISVAGRILLAPGAERFRVVPITTAAAGFLYRRWIVLGVVVGFTWQSISLFSRFGLSPLSGELWADTAGLVMVVVVLDIVWRTPHASLGRADDPSRWTLLARHRASFATGVSLLMAFLWMLWVVRAFQAFWLLAFATGLPLAMMIARRSVNHILRPPGAETSVSDAQTLDVIVFERGIRSIVIVVAALLLGRILRVDFTSLTMDDTVATRLMRGAISVVIIGLLADLVWRVTKALIDRRLARSLLRDADSEEIGHAARLQTLLPIISNILLALIVVVAGMMMLASAGVEIGPLIASAGVVGVAIGFGAQTLVRDVISGIFYLVDDAFRIGEYIQSGTFKGTVESFSLRSVKLRHQRGALYTVPFGILGAVQNQSRDWVVDKIVLNIPYGSDLDKVRKIIKKIGETLAEDPEFAPEILNPLKMQGVVQFGDFAIQIQTKMMTKPGDVQFLARRRALLLINKAFVEHGIGFAMPVVHVAGNGESAAAALKGYELTQAAKTM